MGSMEGNKSNPVPGRLEKWRQYRVWTFVCVALMLVNTLQAAFTNLTGDEALYWMYGKHLDWGFKDHPPLIGLLTAAGSTWLPGELGARLGAVLCSGVMIWLLRRLARPTLLWPFALIVLSVPVLHVYGFIATPDVPLLLTAVCYLLTWRSFLNSPDLGKALILGFWMAAMMWSKYHGLLVILFSLLPVRKMWWNRLFWTGSAFGALLFLPHVIWQVVHDFPTVRFHLFERAGEFRWSNVTEFVTGQAGVFNPVLLFLTILVIARFRAKDEFERSLRGLFTGLMVFFIAMSARGRVEAHWSATCVFPMLFILIRHGGEWIQKSWFAGYSSLVVLLILAVRVALVTDFIPGLHGMFFHPKERLALIHEIAQGKPVCFMNSYQSPSLYMFYFGERAHSVQNVEGGRNQYDWWNYNEYVHQNPFLFVASYEPDYFDRTESGDVVVYSKVYADLPCFDRLTMIPERLRWNLNRGDTVWMAFTMVNANSYPIDFSGEGHRLKWSFLLGYKKLWQQVVYPEWIDFPERIGPGDSVEVKMKWIADIPSGRYRSGVAVRIDDLPQTYQSPWLYIAVEDQP